MDNRETETEKAIVYFFINMRETRESERVNS
jgi:hypothetical protein